MPSVAITEYTDPTCPFAFSAEPHRLRLNWLFGDQLSWDVRMVGLSDERRTEESEGFTPSMAAKGAAQLYARFGMPMSEEVREAIPASVVACRAFVAVRRHAPEQAWAFLREVRHGYFRGEMLDEPAFLRAAASTVGLDPDALEAWIAEPDTETALAEDMRLARTPSPPALALKGKLARSGEDGWRYTCPSYEMVPEAATTQFSAPGMQSSLNYETALANLAPDLERRAEPEDVTEVLRWAGHPLATQEVAEVCGIPRDQAREQLEAAGAQAETVGRDAFWTLAA